MRDLVELKKAVADGSFTLPADQAEYDVIMKDADKAKGDDKVFFEEMKLLWEDQQNNDADLLKKINKNIQGGAPAPKVDLSESLYGESKFGVPVEANLPDYRSGVLKVLSVAKGQTSKTAKQQRDSRRLTCKWHNKIVTVLVNEAYTDGDSPANALIGNTGSSVSKIKAGDLIRCEGAFAIAGVNTWSETIIDDQGNESEVIHYHGGRTNTANYGDEIFVTRKLDIIHQPTEADVNANNSKVMAFNQMMEQFESEQAIGQELTVAKEKIQMLQSLGLEEHVMAMGIKTILS